MKPSPYFTDRFRYFFKRFYSEKALFEWFKVRSGEDSGSFSFPEVLKGTPKTLIFLPKDLKLATAFLKELHPGVLKNTKFCVHESLQAVISAHRAHAFYYSDLECRYGEETFKTLEQKIKEFAPTVCIYLGENFLPRLYLAKVSGASVRMGFKCEKAYPFLNVSLCPEKSTEAGLINQYYEVQ